MMSGSMFLRKIQVIKESIIEMERTTVNQSDVPLRRIRA